MPFPTPPTTSLVIPTGATTGSRVVIGVDANGADGVRLYGPDGVTPVVDLRADTGAASFSGTVTVDATVAGSALTLGAVVDLVLNGNMEDANDLGTAPALWLSDTGASALQFGTPPLAGSRSLLFACSSAGPNRVYNPTFIPTSPGEQLYATALAAIASAGAFTGRVILYFYDSSHAFVSLVGPTASVVDTSTRKFTNSATTPNGAAFVRIGFEVNTTAVVNAEVDGFSLYRQLPIDATASGTIQGQFIVGSPAGKHVVIGSDAAGANGVRMYDSDGTTVLIDLNITGTPTITSAIIQTSGSLSVGGAAAGVKLAGNVSELDFYTGQAGETAQGVIAVGSTAMGLVLTSPTNSVGALNRAQITLQGHNSGGNAQILLNPDTTSGTGTVDIVGNLTVNQNVTILTNKTLTIGAVSLAEFFSGFAILNNGNASDTSFAFGVTNSNALRPFAITSSGRMTITSNSTDAGAAQLGGANAGQLYVLNGALRYRGGSGTFTTVAAA